MQIRKPYSKWNSQDILDQDDDTTIVSFIIEEVKEIILNFSQESITVL